MSHTDSPVSGTASAAPSGDGPSGDGPSGHDPSPDGAGSGPVQDGGRRRRRGRGRRLVLWGLIAVLVLTAGGAGWAYWRADDAASSIDRIPDAIPREDGEKEGTPGGDGKGVTFLLVGLDTRSSVATTGEDAQAPSWKAGASRSDTMMLLHFSEDRRHASVVSLPRDTWVDVPGRGEAKLNAAYSWGGPALTVRTVEQLTGVGIDHLAVIDWNGFRALTDAVGGVDITVPEDVPGGGDQPGYTAGTHRMNGEEALAYVRERKNLPNGDLDRTKRQQNFLRALMQRVLSSGTLSSPGTVTDLLDSVDEVVSVDDRLTNSALYDLTWSMRALRPSAVHFMNAPFGGFDNEDGQSVVKLDREKAAPLWKAMEDDEMAAYVAENSGQDLDETVR